MSDLYGILISLEHYESFKQDLTPEGVGKVVLALMEAYLYGKEPELEPVERSIYRYLKRQVDESVEKHGRRVDAARKAIATRWGNDTESETTVYERIRPYPDEGKNKNKNKSKDKDKYKEKEEEKEEASGLDGLMESFGLDESVREALRSFAEMRKESKAPMSDRSAKLLIDKLISMSKEPETQKAIVEQSVMNGWKGIFPLSRETKKPERARTFRQINAHDHGTDYNALVAEMIATKGVGG